MKRKFLKGHSVKRCEYCDTDTTLWENGRTGSCDICFEAGGFYNGYCDGDYETEESTFNEFVEWANSWYSSISMDRLKNGC